MRSIQRPSVLELSENRGGKAKRDSLLQTLVQRVRNPMDNLTHDDVEDVAEQQNGAEEPVIVSHDLQDSLCPLIAFFGQATDAKASRSEHGDLSRADEGATCEADDDDDDRRQHCG